MKFLPKRFRPSTSKSSRNVEPTETNAEVEAEAERTTATRKTKAKGRRAWEIFLSSQGASEDRNSASTSTRSRRRGRRPNVAGDDDDDDERESNVESRNGKERKKGVKSRSDSHRNHAKLTRRLQERKKGRLVKSQTAGRRKISTAKSKKKVVYSKSIGQEAMKSKSGKQKKDGITKKTDRRKKGRRTRSSLIDDDHDDNNKNNNDRNKDSPSSPGERGLLASRPGSSSLPVSARKKTQPERRRTIVKNGSSIDTDSEGMVQDKERKSNDAVQLIGTRESLTPSPLRYTPNLPEAMTERSAESAATVLLTPKKKKKKEEEEGGVIVLANSPHTETGLDWYEETKPKPEDIRRGREEMIKRRGYSVPPVASDDTLSIDMPDNDGCISRYDQLFARLFDWHSVAYAPDDSSTLGMNPTMTSSREGMVSQRSSVSNPSSFEDLDDPDLLGPYRPSFETKTTISNDAEGDVDGNDGGDGSTKGTLSVVRSPHRNNTPTSAIKDEEKDDDDDDHHQIKKEFIEHDVDEEGTASVMLPSVNVQEEEREVTSAPHKSKGEDSKGDGDSDDDDGEDDGDETDDFLSRPMITSNRKILDELVEVEEANAAATAEGSLTDRRKIVTTTREGPNSIIKQVTNTIEKEESSASSSASNQQLFSWEKFFSAF